MYNFLKPFLKKEYKQGYKSNLVPGKSANKRKKNNTDESQQHEQKLSKWGRAIAQAQASTYKLTMSKIGQNNLSADQKHSN